MKLAILGAGPGGYVAAIRAAQSGAQVTVVEETEVGGTCLNKGCIPTKCLIASTELLSRIKTCSDFGLDLRGECVPNLLNIVGRKNRVVTSLVKGVRSLFKSHGIALKEGRGMLRSSNELSVTGRNGAVENLPADNIIIATGSRPAEIPFLPFDGESIISSDHAIDLAVIPKSILIIGAGAVGCEFACIFRELGSEVALVELLPRVLPAEDIEISDLLARELKKKKISLHTGISVQNVEKREDGMHVILSDGKEILTEKILVSAGRSLNSSGLGLEEIGVQKGLRGEIVVNSRMQTSIPGVYAVGDVTGEWMLAHVAASQGIVAVRNIMGDNGKMDYSAIPAATFTSPEIASVGLREQEAEGKGIKVQTGHFPFRALGKAQTAGEFSGLIKIVAESASDKLLGVHIIGPRASDLIHEASLAIKKGLRAKDIADTVHAHPTFSEGIKEAAEDLSGRAIHIIRK